jgi:hypothetical protein
MPRKKGTSYDTITAQKERMTYKILRKMALDKLGGKCARCGFSDYRALQIDHVNGGGLEELRAYSWRGYLPKVLEDKDNNYVCLCANCNWIKRAENDENPSARAEIKIDLEIEKLLVVPTTEKHKIQDDNSELKFSKSFLNSLNEAINRKY